MIWILWGTLILLAVLLIVWLFAGLAAYRYACLRKPPYPIDSQPDGPHKTESAAYLRSGLAYAEEHPWEDVWLRRENVWLHAFWFDGGSDRTAIVCHGYTGHGVERFGSVPLYAGRGFNVLVPDLRAHGQSEGRWIGMGGHDARDVAGWVEWLRTNTKLPQRVMLDGVSMGSATVLSVAGMNLPEVRYVLADCGFTSTWDEFMHCIRKLPKWLAAAILTASNLWSRRLSGNDMHHPSPLDAVRKTSVPILFVHGESDDFVPPWMGKALYEACTSEKELLLVPNAEHVASFFVDPDEYLRRMDQGIEKYIGAARTEAK